MSTTIRLGILLAVTLISVFGRAQGFSADVVYLPNVSTHPLSSNTDTTGHNPSKLYVSNGKVRLETRGLIGTILLVDREEESAYAMLPSKKEYELLAGGLSEYFAVKDPENACPEWQKATRQKILCEKLGHEVIGSRDTVKYKNKNASDFATSAVWIDSALKFVLKWESESTCAELRNIQEGQQPADLFNLPSSYTVVQPRKSANNKRIPK